MGSGVPVFVLCGGLATRLQEFNGQKPKVLLSVRGVPMLKYILTWCQIQNLQDVVLLVGHRSEQVKEFVRRMNNTDLNIMICDEGDRPIGTAAAIRNAWLKTGKSQLAVVVFGDSILGLHAHEAIRSFNERDFPIQMTGVKSALVSEPPNIQSTHGIVVQYPCSQPIATHVDYGITIFSGAAIDQARHADLKILLSTQAREHNVGFLEVPSKYVEIGTVNSLIGSQTTPFDNGVEWANSLGLK